jgi:hypothetical protein
MQAEGGFGSRQFDVGCLVSMVEFGPQQSAAVNTTRPASKIFLQVLISHKPNLEISVYSPFTKLFAGRNSIKRLSPRSGVSAERRALQNKPIVRLSAESRYVRFSELSENMRP